MITGRRMGPSYGPLEGGASVRAARRALRDGGIAASPATVPLEVQRRPEEPPRVEAARPIEGDAVRVRPAGAPEAGIAAFLDGVQRSEPLAHVGAVPIVHGAVGAVVRRREGRALRTWDAPLIARALYAPLPLLPAALVAQLRGHGVDLRDTADGPDAPSAPVAHPADLAARALTAVQRERERLERTLLERWVAGEGAPLLVDGGISASEPAANSLVAVGVVKSHRTLYADAAALPLVLGLREGERTTAVRITSARRHAVASWYLRLRDPAGRGPLHGLVRVEVADGADLTVRADRVSRWILAERAPVALPDARWDVMSYGVRDCEQYLTSILR